MAIPRIAITAGEPAGIGPDIVLAAAQQTWNAELVIIADPELLRQRAQLLGLPLQLREYDPQSEPAVHRPGELVVQPCHLAQPCTPGILEKANAPYVLATLQLAIDGCMNHSFQAMVTAPVQKSIINDAGVPFSGHTEFLAKRTGTDNVVMMLAAGDLRVALATTHLPLKDVPEAITRESLLCSLTIVSEDLTAKFGLNQPRIAVLGLNPHAGEGGHLGRDEIETIIPVIEELRAAGMQLTGPLPADTAFNPKVLDDCDTVFAMYHDQGLPVLKYAGFGQAVNITLGLPLVRTSVDHGTALDLAGTSKADAGSLTAAIQMALQCANADRLLAKPAFDT